MTSKCLLALLGIGSFASYWHYLITLKECKDGFLTAQADLIFQGHQAAVKYADSDRQMVVKMASCMSTALLSCGACL